MRTGNVPRPSPVLTDRHTPSTASVSSLQPAKFKDVQHPNSERFRSPASQVQGSSTSQAPQRQGDLCCSATLSNRDFTCSPFHQRLHMQSFPPETSHAVLSTRDFTYSPFHQRLHIQSFPPETLQMILGQPAASVGVGTSIIGRTGREQPPL